jgi:pyruvate dehydrogenase E1 component alpha subunit
MISTKKLIEFFIRMYEIRVFENSLETLFSEGHVHGTCHLSAGQEAVAVGICQYLTQEDIVTSTHRGHGHALAKGLDPGLLLSEFVGRENGYCGGRGGTQHIISKKHNFYTNGITGGMAPIAVGFGFALKYRREKNKVVVCFLGDGGMNEGHVMESLNMASIWMLPILFVCENNLYAMSSRVDRMTHSPSLALRAQAYGITALTIDGNDVCKVYETAKKYIQRMKKTGQGPVFIECMTYRQSGHSINDKNVYRTKDEMEIWAKKDPILRLEQLLVLKKSITPTSLRELKEHVRLEMNNHVEKLLESTVSGNISNDDYPYA